MGSLEANRRRAVPLYVELAALMRQRIRSGDLPVGARMPTLAELQQTYGVSRVTARQAMDLLDEEGLIERGAGRGTFVRDHGSPARERLRLTADLGGLLDMVRGGTAAPVTSAVARVARPEGAFPAHELLDGVPFRSMRRVHSKNGAPFSVVQLYLREDIFQRSPERFEAEIAITVLGELGIVPAAAEQSIVISSADVELAELLGIKLNSPIADVHRVFVDAEDKAIYAARIVYRGDFIAFDIAFR